ncbi:MAG: class I SAM-dependent methyltransferase [Thermodesulfobacteriota bacterium]
MDLYDDRYGFPGFFELRRCDNCGHVFLPNDFSPDQLCELYSRYYPRASFNVDEYTPHKRLRGFCGWLNGDASAAFLWVPPHVKVLDIGCGFGQSLGYLQSRGCEVYGVEADDNIHRVAEKFGFKVHLGLFDPDVYEPGCFDFVTMNQVIEHVTDPGKMLRGVARILKSRGGVVLTTPNIQGAGARIFGKKWINWHAPYHLQFFTRESMRLAAARAGLRLVCMRTMTSSSWLHYQWAHLVTCPPPGTPSKFWAGWAVGKRSEIDGRMKFLLKMLGLLHQGKLNHVLTRLSDAVNMGDNYLFILEKI